MQRAWREAQMKTRITILVVGCLVGVAAVSAEVAAWQVRVAVSRLGDQAVAGRMAGRTTGRGPLATAPVPASAAADAGMQAAMLAGGLGLLLALAGGALVWRMAAGLARPIADAVGVLQAVSAGDLTPRLQDGHGPESGRLAAALNTTLDDVRDTMKVFADHAWQVANASDGMATMGARLKGHAEHATSLSSTASRSTEEVNHSLQAVASGVEEMTASISEIAKNAGEAARIAASAVQVTDSANGIFLKLGESSGEIGKVLKVITSIAEQTNMLALNATIEAARAGEAGRGFAVVANEVKELARQAARAAEDIAQKVQAIQSDTRRAAEAIVQIDRTINQISDIQVVIANSVEEQTATTSEMGRSIAEVARTSSGIGQAIAGVVAASMETLEGAKGRMEAEEELARSSAELRSAVGRFRY
jgi:methyl-accepting chemotaxis protein